MHAHEIVELLEERRNVLNAAIGALNGTEPKRKYTTRKKTVRPSTKRRMAAAMRKRWAAKKSAGKNHL